jgi:hypothetical protein
MVMGCGVDSALALAIKAIIFALPEPLFVGKAGVNAVFANKRWGKLRITINAVCLNFIFMLKKFEVRDKKNLS